MENDKLRHEDEPPGSPSPSQWIQESDIPFKSNEVSNFMGTLNNSNAAGADDIIMPCTTMPFSLFPFGDMHGTSDPYSLEMPLTGINLMTDLTPFSNSQNQMFDYDSRYWMGNTGILPTPASNFLSLVGNKPEFSQHRTLDYSVPPDNVISTTSNVNVLQQPYVDRKIVTANGNSAAPVNSIFQAEEVNNNAGRPQLFRNSISDGVSTPVLCHNTDGGEIDINNNFMTSECEVQEDCPGKVDASFLTLGIGRKTEEASESNRSRRNVSSNFEKVAVPQFNTFHVQKQDRSSLNHLPDVAADLPCFQNNVGGFNVMTSNMSQDDDQHHFLMPGNRNVCHGVEGNWDTRSAYIDPNSSFQGYPTVFLIPVGSSLAGLPDFGWNMTTGMPLPYSSSTSTCLPVSETAKNLLSDSSMVPPPTGVTRSTSLQDQLGKPFTANEGIAAQVAERRDLPRQFRQLPNNYSQCQGIGAVQSSANLSRSGMTGAEIPITKLNRTGQGSSAFVGTSLKRTAEEPPAVISQAQGIKRRTQSSIGSSGPTLSLNVSSPRNLSEASSFTVPAPTAPSLPHQAKSTTLFPPLSQTSVSFPPQAKCSPSLLPISETSMPPLPQAKGTAPLPPLSQNASSIPLQGKNTLLFPPLSQNVSLPTLVRRTTVLPAVSQIAPSLPSQTRTTISCPPLSQTPPYLAPLLQIAPPLTSQPRAAPPLQQKYGTASPLPPQSQTASLLPPKSQTASSLPLQSQTAPPLSAQPQTAPPLPLQPKSASVFHIKWKGAAQTQPIGHKCLLCKRDISFTPEGPVSVPTIPPVAAVLPCGHTFHDHCLRLITPQDQVENPPCIPCAIGES